MQRFSFLAPHKRELIILGLGGSIGTGPMGVKGEVFVVNSFDELTENQEMANSI